MFYAQTPARTLAAIATILGLAAYATFGGFFAKEIVIEIAILAILVIAIDVVAGFGGMVSLCHGAIMGVSAYGYGVLTALVGWPPAPAALAGLVMATAFGAAIAFVTSKTTGIFFIMATLAFGQMAYAVIFRTRAVGGDDGMGGMPRFEIPLIDMNDLLTFALFALALVALTYVVAALVMRSSHGRTLEGIHHNEGRMRALGVSVRGHKVGAFAISSALAGLAGILAAQHTQYISPQLLFWTVSGEVLIVAILGGLGTLVGPLIGAVVFVFLHHEVEAHTDHWHMVVGAILIVAVLAGGRGIWGQAEHWARAARRRRAQPSGTPRDA